MEFRKTMVARKVAIVMVALMAFSGIVAAGVLISNTLSSTIHVNQIQKYTLYWASPASAPDGIYDGTGATSMVSAPGLVSTIWEDLNYSLGVTLYNPNTGGPTYMVNVYLSLYAAGAPVNIHYWQQTGPTPDVGMWLPLGLTDLGGGNMQAAFGPSGGFPVGPLYDVTSWFVVEFPSTGHPDYPADNAVSVSLHAEIV